MKHCIEVVEKSDIVILLINTKSGEEPELRWGNVTPTYLEFQEAWKKKKHILVFVNPDIKKRFFELKRILTHYITNILKRTIGRLIHPLILSKTGSPVRMEWLKDI